MSDAKILLFDVENTPNVSYTWGKYDQNVQRFKKEWWMLCYGWKWLGEKEAHVTALPDYEDYRDDLSNDKRLMMDLRDLWDEADVVIAHNAYEFDIPKSRARFTVHRIPPPSPFKVIDTLKIVRRLFRFNSYKLGDLGETLGLGTKAPDGGFHTWIGCMEGDPEAWDRMTYYCAQDVQLLEKIYLHIRPWIDRHPNLAAISGLENACPNCGEEDTLIRRGHMATTTMTYQRWVCRNCGRWTRSRLSEKGIPKPVVVGAV